MNKALFSELISRVRVGKQLPEAVYLHRDAFSALPPELAKFIPAVAKALNLPDDQWNLVKLFKREFRLSLLHYPAFYCDSYPALKQSLNVDLAKLTHKLTCYHDSDNPPILHRKEIMVLPTSEYYSHFVSLTFEGENSGLYKNAPIDESRCFWMGPELST